MRGPAVWLYGTLLGSALIAGGLFWYGSEILPAPAFSGSFWPRLTAYRFYDEVDRPILPETLRGQVVLLTFIYTRCPSVCLRLSSTLRSLLLDCEASARVTAMSISLDPERDTGAVLRAYARTYAVSGRRWYYWRPESQGHAFLLAREVFGLTAATLPGTGEILHTDAFFLIDCAGRVYGPYSSEAYEKTRKHLKKLVRLCETSSG